MSHQKKFYVGVDCEGLACVVGTPGQALASDSSNYRFAIREATLEADAAARALFDQGAEEVIIWDNHCTGVNLEYDLLDSRCKIALGSGHKARFPEIDDSFGGVLFIGYHAREGTKDAVLAHSYSSVAYQSYQINGIPVGEMEIDAAYAGQFGVPVLFAASDDLCVQQAKESFPWAETVAVKHSLSWNSAISLHPKAAQEQIYQGVCMACSRIEEMMPYTFQLPLDLEIRYKRMDAANSAQLFDYERNPFSFVDAFTRKGRLNKLEHLFD